MSSPLVISCINLSPKIAEKVARSFTKYAHSGSIQIGDGSCWCDGRGFKENCLVDGLFESGKDIFDPKYCTLLVQLIEEVPL